MLEIAAEGAADGLGMAIANLKLVKFKEPKQKQNTQRGSNFWETETLNDLIIIYQTLYYSYILESRFWKMLIFFL